MVDTMVITMPAMNATDPMPKHGTLKVGCVRLHMLNLATPNFE